MRQSGLLYDAQHTETQANFLPLTSETGERKQTEALMPVINPYDDYGYIGWQALYDTCKQQANTQWHTDEVRRQ